MTFVQATARSLIIDRHVPKSAPATRPSIVIRHTIFQRKNQIITEFPAIFISNALKHSLDRPFLRPIGNSHAITFATPNHDINAPGCYRAVLYGLR